MSYYNCFRCGLSTKNKTNMRLHLNRTRKCEPNIRDINVDHYVDDIMNRCEFIQHDDSSHFIPFHPKRLSESSILFHQFRCIFCNKIYKYDSKKL